MACAWTAASRLRLRFGLELAPADQDRWQVRWDFDEITFLEGAPWQRVLPWLLPMLDGTRSMAELEALARERDAIGDLHEVLQCLDQQSLLVESASDDRQLRPSELRAALEATGSDKSLCVARVQSVRPVVCGRSLSCRRILRALQDMEFSAVHVSSVNDLFEMPHAAWDQVSARNVDRSGNPACFPIIVEPDWAVEEVERINRWCLLNRQPWMLVGAWNDRVLVGPIFLPGVTGCYACYRRRLDSHRRHLAAYQALERWRRSVAGPRMAEPVLPATAEIAAAWTALEAFHFVAADRVPRTQGRVLVCFPNEARVDVETVLRVPWCTECHTIRLNCGHGL